MSITLTKRERVLLIVSALLGFGMILSLRGLPEVNAKEGTESSLFQELKTFTDVLAIVQRDYVNEVDNKKVVEGAIKGLLATLDPHSGYLDPDFYQDLQVQTKGEFGGLGVEITIKDGLLVVVAPMEGSPAEKAGVKPGDTIVKIEGRYTKEFSLVDAVKRLRGPRGSPITISLGRKGSRDLIDVTIVRDNIAVKSVRFRSLGDGFGYVRVSQFMENTSDDLKVALETLAKESPSSEIRGLVLDLRNDPGGLLAQAVRVSDFFLRDGIIVYTDGRVDAQKQKFFAHARNTEPDYPMIVLVNGGSASASEIVSGALKDHGRALILGTQTFGKGSVQTITPLENGGALSLTTALYYTKSGRSIQGTGVKPDIEIEAQPITRSSSVDGPEGSRHEAMRESDLPGAIKNPSDPGAKDPMKKLNKIPDLDSVDESGIINPEKDDIATWLSKDNQLERALDLLKSYSVFKGDGFKGGQTSETP